MLTEFKAFMTGARLVVTLAAAVALFVAGGVVAWQAPFVGAGHRISTLEKSRDKGFAAYSDWRRYGLSEREAFRESERLRKAEQGAARGAASDQDAQCDARVAAARASASAINRIIQREPAYVPQTNCPVRRLADPGLVRDGLQPPGPGARR